MLTLAAIGLVVHSEGVYWSRVDVQFLSPQSKANPNAFTTTSQSLVMTAGAVAKAVDPSGLKEHLADQTITLASEGIRHGWAITQPNSGGQWVAAFETPVLQVEAVGTTPDEVSTQMARQLIRVRSQLRRMERFEHVRTADAIRLQYSFPTPPVYFQTGSRPRAVGATSVIGLGLTIAACRALSRRYNRYSSVAPPVEKIVAEPLPAFRRRQRNPSSL